MIPAELWKSSLKERLLTFAISPNFSPVMRSQRYSEVFSNQAETFLSFYKLESHFGNVLKV